MRVMDSKNTGLVKNNQLVLRELHGALQVPKPTHGGHATTKHAITGQREGACGEKFPKGSPSNIKTSILGIQTHVIGYQNLRILIF